MTVTVLVKIDRPVQVASFGPYRLKVIEPVGLTPPASVAESEIAPPMVTGAEAWVTTAGPAWLTTTDSLASLQAPETAALLTSPL